MPFRELHFEGGVGGLPHGSAGSLGRKGALLAGRSVGEIAPIAFQQRRGVGRH